MKQASEPRAGGAILAIAIMAGAVIGIFMGQTSIGVLAGTGIGTLIAVGIWLRDRARRGR